MSAVPSMQRHDPVAEELRAQGAARERVAIIMWLRDSFRWKGEYACMSDGADLADAIARLEHLEERP